MRLFGHRDPPPDPGHVARVIAADVALATALPEAATPGLVELSLGLLAGLRWHGLGDLDLSDDMRIVVAANAAIPILGLDPGLYRAVDAVVVTPGAMRSTGLRRGVVDGVVSDGPATIIGQAQPNTGSVFLSWPAVLGQSRNPQAGRNVVIHEFAHKIDMLDGYSDGIPPVRGRDLARWSDLLDREFHPDRPDPSDEVLPDYAWTNVSEFFAVVTETFFCRPGPLQQAKPDLYQALADWYRQDPAQHPGP